MESSTTKESESRIQNPKKEVWGKTLCPGQTSGTGTADQRFKPGFSETGPPPIEQVRPLIIQPTFKAGFTAIKIDVWTKYTKDTWVLNQVKGMSIPFTSAPKQQTIPFIFSLNALERESLTKELEKMCTLGIIKKVSPTSGQYISNIFTRPKPDGGIRVILDLTFFNQEAVEYKHFKMSSLKTALEMMRVGGWMGSVDLEKCYYSFSILQDHRKFLRFRWNDTLFEYQVLSNGLSSGPRFVTKILNPIFAYLRKQGIEVFVYIDDTFIIADSKEKCQEGINKDLYVLQDLGFFIN